MTLSHDDAQVIGKTEIVQGGGASYDGHSRLKTSSAAHLFNGTNITTKHNSLWSEVTAGGGAIAHDSDRSSVALSVGTSSGDMAMRQSDVYSSYLPGKVQSIGETFICETPKTGLRQEIGYYDDDDGLMFRMDGLEPQFVLRSSTSGAVAETVYGRDDWTQSDGKKDPLNGSVGSGIELDVTKIQLVLFEFLWQGAGFFRFGFRLGGRDIWLHHVDVANVFSLPFMRRPSLPIRYRIENMSATASASTMYEICSAVDSEGGYVAPGLEFSASNGITPVSSPQSGSNILAVRLRQRVAGLKNRHMAQLQEYSVYALNSDAYTEIIHIHDPWYTMEHGGETGGTFTAGDTFDNGAGVTGVVVSRIDANTITYRETGGTGIFAAGDTIDTGTVSATISAGGVPDWTDVDTEDSAVERAADIGNVGGAHSHVISPGYMASGIGGRATTLPRSTSQLNRHGQLHQNHDSSNSDLFVLRCRSMSGVTPSVCAGGFIFRETE